VHPAALFLRLGVHLAQRRPEPQRPIAHRQDAGTQCPSRVKGLSPGLTPRMARISHTSAGP
jgi:hypothetical protein